VESGDICKMTRLFKRNDKTTIAELEEYYSSNNKKNRGWMAWLMAFLSVALTIIILVCLFYLGRWVYRAITDDDTDNTTVSESADDSIELPNFDGDVVGQGNQDGATNSDSTSTETGGVVTDEAASITVDDSQDSNQSTDDSSNSDNSVAGVTTVPDTGAGEMIVLIPISTGVVGYFISRRYLLNQK
jgi:hypothetical protein